MKKFMIFFYFINIFEKMNILAIFGDINEIVENEDLYRNKDDFWKNNQIKNSYFLIERFYI